MYKILNIFKKKLILIAEVFQKLFTPKKRGYLSAWQVLFKNSLWQSTYWRVPNTEEISKRELLSYFFIIIRWTELESVPLSQIWNLRTVS